jgi:TRAP-type C4-dicarboxylate transport system permease large subunit
MPFLLGILVVTLLITIFPKIATFLPAQMKG